MRGSIAGSAREEEPNYFCSTGVGVLGVEVERSQNALAGRLDVDNLDGGELLAPLVVPGDDRPLRLALAREIFKAGARAALMGTMNLIESHCFTPCRYIV